MDSNEVKHRIETLEKKLNSKVRKVFYIITNNRLILIMSKLMKK